MTDKQNTRSSTETDRRHLLQDDESTSVASAATSILDYNDGDRTPRARSPAPSYTSTSTARTAAARHASIADPSPQPYKGFSSEAAYMAALQEWAEEKKYIQPQKQVIGFYGDKTMEEYASGPGLELGWRKKWKARKEQKMEKRRASAAV